ncbi:pyridoxal phosphate-dependent transferase [Baffinella frigidus]|nr:pyridoxal phosphate-dependent transferase [Cryptophyta sp. CCMP2293]
MRGHPFPSLLDLSLLLCGSLCFGASVAAFADAPSPSQPSHLPTHHLRHPSYTHRPLFSSSRSRIVPASPLAFLASWNPSPRAQPGCPVARHGGICGLRAEATRGQDRAPLVEALEAAAGRIGPNFFLPGHQQGRGFPSLLTRTGGIFGGNADILRYDLPEDVEDLDSLRDPSGPIGEAQRLAAELFGARETWFLCNGSSGGVLASLLACVKVHRTGRGSPPAGGGSEGGEEASLRPAGSLVVLPRNSHVSSVNALVLAGATPRFVEPEWDASLGVHHGLRAEDVAREIDACGARSVAAVVLLSPTYFGAIPDLKALVAAAHSRGVPVIVDEAHGAHLPFLPEPLGALSAGADLVVQSTHKTLTALTQASMLHLGAGCLEGESLSELQDAVSDLLNILQSSSPSALLLASLDAARWQQAREEGRSLLARAVLLASKTRHLIKKIPGLHVLEAPSKSGGMVAMDPLRVTVGTAEICSGDEACLAIEESHRVFAEVSEPRCIAMAFGIGTTPADAAALVRALRQLSRTRGRGGTSAGEGGTEDGGRPEGAGRGWVGDGESVMSPRDVFFARTESVFVEASLGRICAETVLTYPPGIPSLLPGQVVTPFAIENLEGGGVVTLRVVAR